MAGYPALNFPAFHVAADLFRRAGWTVRNPVEIGREAFGQNCDAVSPSEFLRADLRVLLDCDAIALLPKWGVSVGARAEAAVAVAIGLSFYDAETLSETPAPDLISISGYRSAPHHGRDAT